jgi:aminoglycoside phosphotransferase (APT) family kinase protein
MPSDSPVLVDVVETPEEAGRLEIPPLIVRTTLAAVLPGEGPVSVDRIGEGHSNATFSVSRGGARWILRRPPRPPYDPRAHDVLREFRMLTALADSAVPVPVPVMACQDTHPIGAPFYIMEPVDGMVIRERIPRQYANTADLRMLADELINALVALHEVNVDGVGLNGLAPPSGYLERQMQLWSGQLSRMTWRRIDALHETEALLRGNVPVSQALAIVHGDYKIDNIIWAPEGQPRLLAIVDWEMATLGDPLADLGFLTALWSEAGDPEGLLIGLFPRIDGEARLPSSEALIERYAEQSGLDVGHLGWYRALAMWKLTILLEVSYGRHLAGTADDPFFERLEAGLPRLAEHALALARQA